MGTLETFILGEYFLWYLSLCADYNDNQMIIIKMTWLSHCFGKGWVGVVAVVVVVGGDVKF